MINEIDKVATEIYSRLRKKHRKPDISDALIELSNNELSDGLLNANILKLGVDSWDLLYLVCHLVLFDRLPEITNIDPTIESKKSIGLFYVNESIIGKWLGHITVVNYKFYYANISRHLAETHRSNYENFTVIYDAVIAARSELKKLENSFRLESLSVTNSVTRSWLNHIYGLASSNKSRFGLLDGTDLADLTCKVGREFSNSILNKFKDNVVHIGVDEFIFKDFDSIREEFKNFNEDLFTTSMVGKLEYDVSNHVSGLFLGKDKYVYVDMNTRTTRLRGIKTELQEQYNEKMKKS